MCWSRAPWGFGSLQGAEQGAAGSDVELRRGLIQDARCFLDISSRGCEDERVPVPLWGQAALPALVLETQPGTRIWPCGIFPVTLAKVPPPGGDGAGDAVLGAGARAQHLGALVPPGSRMLPAFSRVMNQLLPVGALILLSAVLLLYPRSCGLRMCHGLAFRGALLGRRCLVLCCWRPLAAVKSLL